MPVLSPDELPAVNERALAQAFNLIEWPKSYPLDTHFKRLVARIITDCVNSCSYDSVDYRVQEGMSSAERWIRLVYAEGWKAGCLEEHLEWNRKIRKIFDLEVA